MSTLNLNTQKGGKLDTGKCFLFTTLLFTAISIFEACRNWSDYYHGEFFVKYRKQLAELALSNPEIIGEQRWVNTLTEAPGIDCLIGFGLLSLVGLD